MNVAELLTRQSISHPEKPAVIFRDQAISFSQLEERSFNLACALAGLGINKGDKVAIYLPNWPEYIYSYLAIWASGATAVPLDFMLTEDELVSCISHSEAKALIVKPKANLSLSAIQEKCPKLNKIIACHDESRQFISFEDLISQGQGKLPNVKIEDKDCAIIFYTSGTTGKPKGVLINYLQLDASPKAVGYFVGGIKESDISLCALPFSHLGGLIYIQTALSFGITCVLMERFIPVEFLKAIQSQRVTCFWIVPSMYYAILQLKEFESFDLSSLRWIVLFGAPSSVDVIRRFHNYCPEAVLYHGWGMTETNAPTTVIPSGSEKIECVGKPAPWIDVKIFDDNDQETAPGVVGEIVVKSWVVTEGYYKDPALTAQVMRHGWLHTGDLGRFDSEGYLYIVGRKKEMIKVAGEIVFEPEVEACIQKHDDVSEVAVIGVPDKLRGELPKAFVVLKEGRAPDAEKLRYFCREHLAHFKIPHYFEFVDHLPKNRTGKIDKEQLRR